MVNIGDLVGKTDDLSLERGRDRIHLVLHNTVPHFPCEIEAGAVLLQHVHHAKTLFMMPESVRRDPVERPLACVPEGRMSQVMSQRDRLDQIFIETKRLCDRARVLRYFQRMRHARPVMIPVRRQKDLRLVL